MEKWYEDKNLVRKGLILCDLEYNYKLLINGLLYFFIFNPPI